MNGFLLLVGYVIFLPLAFGLFYGIYFLLSLPLRRQERARFFLDLIESGIKAGDSPEATIMAAGRTGDESLGTRFHLLAGYLERGLSFEQAFEVTPFFLPPEIVGMLKAGMKTGRLAIVLPACRQRLTEGAGELLKGHNYLALAGLTMSPAFGAVLTVLAVSIYPKFMAIAADLEGVGTSATGLLHWLSAHQQLLLAGQGLALTVFYGAVLLYLAGPRARSLFAGFAPWLYARLVLWLPWRRMRIQRDFSATLAVLLDAGLPESSAVTLAAESSGNLLFQRRAALVVDKLRRGAKLSEALLRLDSGGEFRWRLANAARANGGFLAALAGWHEALGARAFRQEQTFAQLLTTSLVLFNGLLVGAVALAVFQLLTSIDQAAVLW